MNASAESKEKVRYIEIYVPCGICQ